MKRSNALVVCCFASGVAAACSSDPGGPTRLEVQMLSVSGDVAGQTLAMPDGTLVQSGERSGEIGNFFFDGPSLSVQLSACPLGQGAQSTDPYGTGTVGGGPGDPVPVFADAGPDAPSPLIGGIECRGNGLFVCSDDRCTSFEPRELQVAIDDAGGWRHVVADAAGTAGTARIELRYREIH